MLRQCFLLSFLCVTGSSGFGAIDYTLCAGQLSAASACRVLYLKALECQLGQHSVSKGQWGHSDMPVLRYIAFPVHVEMASHVTTCRTGEALSTCWRLRPEALAKHWTGSISLLRMSGRSGTRNMMSTWTSPLMTSRGSLKIFVRK